MTSEQLKQIAPDLDFNKVNDLFNTYGLDTPFKQAMFLAQCSHESGNFRYKEENLNYSVDSIKRVFPGYFSNGKRNPAEYARNPEKLANLVYNDANRSEKSKLGNTQPGDGYKFRGRGYIQLTGRNNYEKFSNKIGKSLDDTIAYLTTNEGALESALYFWDREQLNDLCDQNDVKGSCVKVTKRINGGDNGLNDRLEKLNEYFSILTK